MTRIFLLIAALTFLLPACKDTIVQPDPAPIKETCFERRYHSTDNGTHTTVVTDSTYTVCEIEYE